MKLDTNSAISATLESDVHPHGVGKVNLKLAGQTWSVVHAPFDINGQSLRMFNAWNNSLVIILDGYEI
jgi:hypothetical protein